MMATKERPLGNNQIHRRDVAADALCMIHVRTQRMIEKAKRGQLTVNALIIGLQDTDRDALTGLMALQAMGAKVDIA